MVNLLLSVLLSFNSEQLSSIQGEWVLRFKTVGERVELNLEIEVNESFAVARCAGTSFKIEVEDDLFTWDLVVPAIYGLQSARFMGRFRHLDKISGIFLMSNEPYSGRAIRWSAERKLSSGK